MTFQRSSRAAKNNAYVASQTFIDQPHPSDLMKGSQTPLTQRNPSPGTAFTDRRDTDD